jgi:hypothetical protein
MSQLKRREFILGGTALAAASVTGAQKTDPVGSEPAGGSPEQAPTRRPLTTALESHFRFGLNTSTIRGQKLPIVEEVAIAQKAGYTSLEPWIDELERFKAEGGSLEDLGKRLRDAQISVESAIGFFDWVVDDPKRRRQGLESARRAMDLVRQIGGKRLAAPPAGATDEPVESLPAIAERYRALLELGDTMDVVPQVEIWGGSKTLSNLGEAACVAIAADHPQACILADVYHLYRGGSGFGGIKLLSGRSITRPIRRAFGPRMPTAFIRATGSLRSSRCSTTWRPADFMSRSPSSCSIEHTGPRTRSWSLRQVSKK